MKNSILITGGAGYIGSHTALLMAQQGYNVIIVDALLHGQKFDYPWATCIKGDIADTAILRTIFTEYNIHAVMHFAAFIEVGKSVKAPLEFYENNVTKTLTLLQVMLEYNVKKFIFSSSCAVYGEPQTLPLTESHPKNPISPYGKTKLIVEMALQDLHIAYGLHYVGLRYFNAAGALPEFGLGEHHEPETHVIPLLLRAARNGTPFYIYGNVHQTPDGTCLRDFLHVWDIAHAHAQALKHLDAGHPSDFFNLGTGKGISVKELLQLVEKTTNTKINSITHDARPGDPAILVADPLYAYTVLGWQPNYSDIQYILKTAYAAEHNLTKQIAVKKDPLEVDTKLAGI